MNYTQKIYLVSLFVPVSTNLSSFLKLKIAKVAEGGINSTEESVELDPVTLLGVSTEVEDPGTGVE
jgi:hypothetical protein